MQIMKKAWLAQWSCDAKNKEEYLRRFGIGEKVIDIISARKEIEEIEKVAIDIYKRQMLSFSEKVYLSDYLKGEKRKKEFFGKTIPVSVQSAYTTELYRTLMRATSEKGLSHSETLALGSKWKEYVKSKHLECVTVGCNPRLEIRKVFNLTINKSDKGNEVIKWNWPLADGGFKREKYECKKTIPN